MNLSKNSLFIKLFKNFKIRYLNFTTFKKIINIKKGNSIIKYKRIIFENKSFK